MDTVKFRETNNVKRNDFMDLMLELKKYGSLNQDNGSNGTTQSKYSKQYHRISLHKNLIFLKIHCFWMIRKSSQKASCSSLLVLTRHQVPPLLPYLKWQDIQTFKKNVEKKF